MGEKKRTQMCNLPFLLKFIIVENSDYNDGDTYPKNNISICATISFEYL
jgi:hypothetical protein